MESALSKKPILLFLHGVGNGDPDNVWQAHLTKAFDRLGYPALDPGQVIVPKYAHALKGLDEKVPLPKVTIKEPSRDAARKNRRDFERRIGAIEFRLGRHDGGKGWAGNDAVVDVAFALPWFIQARNYVNNIDIRAQVLTRILAQLPTTGRLVIVGHSLGSVIAADLLRRLPIGLNVVGMVTIGSPLANGNFDVEKISEALKEPPTNLAWWVNFWNDTDPVAAHRGVCSVFPWLVDFRIHTPLSPHVHAANEYLSHDSVATAIGFALFGSKSTELARVENGVDIPLDESETVALLALRYAYLLQRRLKGEEQDKFSGALRQVQAAAVNGIKRRNAEKDRALPAEVARLDFDLADPDATVPTPLPGRYVSKYDAVVWLTVLAAENVIRPFEIGISRDEWQEAMKDLTAELGLGGQYGTDVFIAAKEAQAVLSGGRGRNWVKWGALGAGAVAIVVATGGLALAAGAGLTGAAVITSALASFGPGGMIGGLLTAGSLVTAGGGGIAYGLASPGTTAETLEAVVQRWLAAAILRQRQHLDPDPTLWGTLVKIEMEVRREFERLDEFSDASSPALTELKRKIDAIARALAYIRKNGLEPGLPSDADEQ